jgi:hypothetical protein
MPNYVKNQLEIIGHKNHIEDVLKSLRSKENPDVVFDFDSFLPMPEELKKVTSPTRIVTLKEFKAELKKMEENPNSPFNRTHSITQKMSNDYKERFGVDNWYDWACRNWGTKWGACDSVLISKEPDAEKPEYVRVKIEFQTAWSSGAVAIQQLSGMFPDFVFHVTYADEDCGYNVGKYKFKQGNVKNEYLPEGGSNEAMELYFQCWGESENWEMVNGKWEFVDN